MAPASRSPFGLLQDNVLNIINQIMDLCIPQDRAPRDFCVKFPEEIRHDSLAGQLWFGAEVAACARALGPSVGLIQPCLCEPCSAPERGSERGTGGCSCGLHGEGTGPHASCLPLGPGSQGGHPWPPPRQLWTSGEPGAGSTSRPTGPRVSGGL